MWADFEFHASDLWNLRAPFDKLDRAQAISIFENCVSVISAMDIEVVYGAVDVAKLKSGLGIYSSAHPIDMAFRLCANKVEEWFCTKAPHDFGLLISDDTKNTGHKNAMQNAFRMLRPKARFSGPIDKRKGRLEHFHDDMYFGDSRHCVGIQMADMCSFLIMRHLDKQKDTELIYGLLKSQVALSEVAP